MDKTHYSRPLILVNSILFFALMLGSCTVYYKTSDIKKTFSQSQRETNKILGKIAKDRHEKHGIYNQLRSNIPDSSLPPYPALSVELGKMDRVFAQIKQTVKQLELLKANFSRLVKGSKKIEGNSPLWDDFQTIKKEYEAQSENFESQSNTYTKSSNRFIELLNKHKISRLNVLEVKQQIDKYLLDLNQAVQKLSDEIIGRQQNPKTDKNILSQLEQILTSIQTDQQSLKALVQQFEKEVGAEPTIWSGPGMYSYSILSNMEAVGDKISGQGKVLNKLTGNL